jgi:hypothetical protein
MTLLELQMLKLILFILLFASCSKEKPTSEANTDYLLVLSTIYDSSCFLDSKGSGIMRSGIWGDPTGVNLCRFDTMCDRKNSKRCITFELCSEWIRSDVIKEKIAGGRLKIIKCP